MGNKKTLLQIVDDVRCGVNEDENLEIILERFRPLMIKKAYMLNGLGEIGDFFTSVYKALMTMPLNESRFRDDKYIVGYIASAIRNEAASIIKRGIKHKNVLFDDKTSASSSADPDDIYDELWHGELLSDIKMLLTADEFDILWLAYIAGYSKTEISVMRNVTRQAVFQRLKKIKGKLAKGGIVAGYSN